MFGSLFSGLTKIFETVGSGIARISQAVTGVGATVATTGAAKGLGSLGSGAFGSLGNTGSVLGNILSGATKVATGGLASPLVDAAGGLGRGLFAAAGETATGLAPLAAGATDAVTTSATGSGGLFSSAMDFLKSESGGALIGGLGEGLMKKAEVDALAEEREEDRQYLRDKEQRLQDSFSVDPNAFAGNAATPPVAATQRPTPAQKFDRYEYQRGKGVIRVPA
jgi:hypothetical protein